MRVRSEMRRTLVWVLDQKREFYAIEMAKGLGVTPESARKSLQRLESKGLIRYIENADPVKVYYTMADRDRCETMAAWRPKVANGYIPVKQRTAPLMINSVWSLGA